MIIDNLQKLQKFFCNKPIQFFSNCLDCTQDFVLRQITYSYFMAMGLIAISTANIILPSSTNNTQFYFRTTTSSLLSTEKFRSAAGTVFTLAQTGSRKAMRAVNYVKPTPENIKTRLPFSVIVSYSVTGGMSAGLKFRLSLKTYEHYAVAPILQYDFDENISCGIYSDVYQLTKPLVPALQQAIANREFQQQMIEFFERLSQYLSAWNRIKDVWLEHPYREILDDNESSHSLQSNQSVQSNQATADITELDADADASVRSSSPPHLVRTASLYPSSHGRGSRNNRRVPRNRAIPRTNPERTSRYFRNFQNHVLSTVSFRIQFLKTLIIRIEQ